jgi:hypothetical protein
MQPERSTEEKTLMKVGRITILIALLLAMALLPLTAFAGTPPCDDLEGDTICDNVDNCPPGGLGVTANPAQTDTDGDGRGDVCDNCTAIANGPLVFAPGLSPAFSQCDKDSDGYGNACDGDFSGDGFVTPADNGSYVAALMLFIPPAPGQNDMNCDGFMTPADGAWYTAQLMAFLPGPSGWSCKGVTTGACPPLP